MIAIIDYGIGNIHSVFKAVEKLGGCPQITSDPELIGKSRGVILPGVGSFGEAMEELEHKGLVSVIQDLAQQSKPFLGICLGLQLMFEQSQESPKVKGLSLIPGEVRRLPPTNKIPHMGWNQVYFRKTTSLTQDFPPGRFFYFAHSFYAFPKDEDVVIGIANYNVVIPVIVHKDSLWGLQFHPEKSSKWGMTFLEKWLRETS